MTHSPPSVPDPDPAPAPTPAPGPNPKGGRANFAVELGPVLVFMLAYNIGQRTAPSDAIFIATGAFMAATLAALLYAWRVQKRFPPLLIVTATVVLVFGGLTLILHDKTFVFLKPTIINGLLSSAIFGGLLLRKNALKLLLGSALDLPERIWTVLAVRFGLFYAFLAGLNVIIWQNFSEAFWVNFRLAGIIPITLVFLLANLPLVSKHLRKAHD